VVASLLDFERDTLAAYAPPLVIKSATHITIEATPLPLTFRLRT
jgi:hypothetical protein